LSLSENQLIRVVAVDPGVTTGIVVHEVLVDGVNTIWKKEELGPDKHHLDLWKFLQFNPPSVLVCERFEYRNVRHKGANMPGIRLESREYIGVCELYSQMHNVHLEMQPVASAKNLFTDNKLKGLGLYRAPSGRQHMNDATRHALYYIVVTLGRRDYLERLRPS
jgi:hypothetical protein